MRLYALLVWRGACDLCLECSISASDGFAESARQVRLQEHLAIHGFRGLVLHQIPRSLRLSHEKL